MMHATLPRRLLADLPGGAEDVVLCATAALAADLRRAHGEIQARRGHRLWRPLQGATLAQWLEHTLSAALLGGEIPSEALPGRMLTLAQERQLWEAALLKDVADSPLAGLFDRDALVAAAMEADWLDRFWRIEVPEGWESEEYRAFRRWQKRVAEQCRRQRWVMRSEAVLWRIGCLERGAGTLPPRLSIAGFAQSDPLLARVLAVLEARGVALFELDFASMEESVLRHFPATDLKDECRAAAAWACQWRTRQPQARLRIAVADLPATRFMLEAALEAALHPQAVGAEWAALPRDYVFVDGQVLAETEPVATALRLLRLAVNPRQVALAEFGALLCAPGWSRDMREADLRARLDVVLRERLPAQTTLERIMREAMRFLEREENVCGGSDAGQGGQPALGRALAALQGAALDSTGRALPSQWAARFAAWLEAFGWPGERPLLASERAACDALAEVFSAAGMLDELCGRLEAARVLREFVRQGRERRLPPPRYAQTRTPAVEVCRLADALSGSLDGLWLMGLNEGVWPPQPRPNPLLPAAVQRVRGIPAASATALAAAAQEALALWQKSAAEVVFSWAQREGERRLRRSPLLEDVQARSEPLPSDAAGVRPAPFVQAIELIDDAWAPEVAASERIRGGTALLAAQAICPAWAFYRYRLGAAVLPAPTFLLDAQARGALLHLALEAFWRGRAQADLLRLSATGALAEEIARGVALALAEFNRRAAEPLPPRLMVLEAARLETLLARWLTLEATRAPFQVLACEERHEVVIEGLPIRLVVDRVDALEDGRLIVLDYKSGRNARAGNWGEARLTEPQLPIYASCVYPDRPVAAVALAKVVGDAPGFEGIAEERGLLPEVKSLDEQRRRYASDAFPDWPALRRRWAEAIAELAREFRDGTAAVVFARESELAYCEVKPLLRLAERRRQWEETREETGGTHFSAAGEQP